jgi:transposase
MRGPRFPVNLESGDRKLLEKISRKHSEKASIVLRAKIILLANAGKSHQDIAKKLGTRLNTIADWTARWYEMRDKPVRERLQDLPRPGAPDTFTPEQLCQIIISVSIKNRNHQKI